MLQAWGFRKWYGYISRIDKSADVIFMNFGYWYDDAQIPLSEDDEKNRVSIQLYHKLASFLDLEGLDICEVGSGRGGGLAYIHKQCGPKNTFGLDLNRRAVEFCNKYYQSEGLRFVHGDAQKLPFEDDKFDVVINVESSHRYAHFATFLHEVNRCLKPGGHLLLTDFRHDHEIEDMIDHIKNSDLKLIHHEVITKNVVNSLKSDDGRRRNLVRKLVPGILHQTALNFSGVVGSDTFSRFCNGKTIYFMHVLKKE